MSTIQSSLFACHQLIYKKQFRVRIDQNEEEKGTWITLFPLHILAGHMRGQNIIRYEFAVQNKAKERKEETS